MGLMGLGLELKLELKLMKFKLKLEVGEGGLPLLLLKFVMPLGLPSVLKAGRGNMIGDRVQSDSSTFIEGLQVLQLLFEHFFV